MEIVGRESGDLNHVLYGYLQLIRKQFIGDFWFLAVYDIKSFRILAVF